jgi:hypothetical protein
MIMEITEIETHVLSGGVDAATIPSVGSVEVGSVLVEVHTDEDITGLGESFHRQRVEDNIMLAKAVESLEQYLIGEDPRRITEHWSDLYVHAKRSGAYKALSAIDEALWDIAGKRAGVPLYQLLGGKHGELGAYATFPIQKEAEALLEDGRWLAEKGFDCLKITAGLGVETDRQRIDTIASGLPDGFGLAIDANTSYDFTDAIRLANSTEEHELVWFEEPIAHTDIEGYAEFRRQTTVPVAGYQTHTTRPSTCSGPGHSTSISPHSTTRAASRVPAAWRRSPRRSTSRSSPTPLARRPTTRRVCTSLRRVLPVRSSSSAYSATTSTTRASSSRARTRQIRTNSLSKTAVASRRRTDPESVSS